MSRLTIILLINILITLNIYAVTYTSNGSGGGVWDVNTTWTVGGITPALGEFPGSGDDVIIQAGDIVTARSSDKTRFKNITISGEFQVNAGEETYVYGDTENNGTISGTGNYWQVRDGTYTGTGTITSKLVCSFQKLTIDVDLTITNELFAGSSGEIVNKGILTIDGIIKGAGNSSITNEGTIVVNSSSFFPSTQPSSILSSTLGDIIWNTTSNFKKPSDGYKNVTINQTRPGMKEEALM